MLLGYSSYQIITVINHNITVTNCANSYRTGTTLLLWTAGIDRHYDKMKLMTTVENWDSMREAVFGTNFSLKYSRIHVSRRLHL